jgi:hypothetical protein
MWYKTRYNLDGKMLTCEALASYEGPLTAANRRGGEVAFFVMADAPDGARAAGDRRFKRWDYEYRRTQPGYTKPSKQPRTPRRRGTLVGTWLTPGEVAALRTKAKAQGLSISASIRTALEACGLLA